MKSEEVELLFLRLPEAVDFSICGPAPREQLGASPSLARTSLLHAGKSEAIEFRVLTEAGANVRTASTLPFLFEQTQYQFNLAIHLNDGRAPRLLLRGQDQLVGKKRIGNYHAYSVPLNFQSEVGYTDVELWLGLQRFVTLRLEVFPTKLDYRTDLLELRADLQMEVRALVFELCGRTFQTLHRAPGQRPKDVEWLTILRTEFKKLTHALEIITRSPLQKVQVTHVMDRSLRPLRPSSQIREYLRKNGNKCVEFPNGHFVTNGRSWLSPQVPRMSKRLTPDTPENRFVASAVGQMRARLRRLRSQLAGVQNRSRFAPWSDFLDESDRRLRRFQTQTFLSSLASHQAHAAQTLALHLTPGYREFFSSYLALESVLEIGGGPLELPEKDLATLYELWCFVSLAAILRRELGLTPRHPTWLRVTQRRVALELVQGRTSVLSMEKDGQECLRVIYNREDPTPTGSCFRPDNTLEIFKQGSSRHFRYVFDAREAPAPGRPRLPSRLQSAPVRRPTRFIGCTPIGTKSWQNKRLNPRTRSVEATVWDLGYRQWVQQTIGAFVLYPYAGADAAQNRFVQAIGKVAVGGVPFLPSRQVEVTKLLKHIIEMSAENVEDTAVELSTGEERQRIGVGARIRD